MANMYHLFLYDEGEYAHVEGGSDGGDSVGMIDAVLMRIVDGSDDSGDGISGGVGAQVVTARSARHFFHVVLKAYVDLAERSRTFKEQQQCADWMEIVKILERKSEFGGNRVALSVIT